MGDMADWTTGEALDPEYDDSRFDESDFDCCFLCGIGYFLPSGRCDHCDLPRIPTCPDCGGRAMWRCPIDGPRDKKCRDCGVVT